MQPIHRTIEQRLLLGTACLLLLTGALLGRILHLQLVREFDLALRAKSDALIALTALDGHLLDIDYNENAMPEFEPKFSGSYFAFFLPDGSCIAASPSLHGIIFPLHPQSGSLIQANGNIHGSVRILQRTFHPQPDEPHHGEEPEEDAFDEIEVQLDPDLPVDNLILTLAVARDRSRLNGDLQKVYSIIAAFSAILMGGIVFITRRSVAHGLKPLHEFNRQIHDIQATELQKRIELGEPPLEVADIVFTVNALLERLQTAFERERAFSINVAHELRTPVSELRTASELAAKFPEDTEQVTAYFRDVQEIALHMERVVSNLLLLGRCDQGRVVVNRSKVDLVLLLLACIDRLQVTDREFLEIHLPDHLLIESDANMLRFVLGNLLENAVFHRVPGTAICLRASGTVLTLENQVSGMTPADLPNLFHRFWQLDTARSADEHAGLGLSIVQAVCQLLHIDLSISLADDESRFQVTLRFDSPQIESGESDLETATPH